MTLEDLKKQYVDLMNSNDEISVRDEKLKEIKKQLVEQYNFEAEAIERVNSLRKDGIDTIDEEINKERDRAISETRNAFNASLDKINTYGKTELTSDEFLFDFTTMRKEIIDLFDVVRDESGKVTGFRLSAENPIEFKQKLEDVRIKMVQIENETGKLDGDNLILFNAIDDILNSYTIEEGGFFKNLANDIGSFFILNENDFNEAIEGIKLRAEKLYEEFARENGSYEDVFNTDYYEEWYKNLLNKVKNVYGEENLSYFKNAFNDMFMTMTPSLESIEDKASNVYSELLALILKAKQELSDLDGETNKAAESIDELLKLISDNKDSDKFFSSKEIIEFLDKYPELTKAIEVTQYGYKLNEKALKDLKDAKLKEAKATLQA